MAKTVKIADFKYDKNGIHHNQDFDQRQMPQDIYSRCTKFVDIPGGSQGKMSDTVWVGRVKRMLFNLVVKK